MSEKLFKRLILLQLGAFGLTIIFLAVEAGDTELEAISEIIGEYSLISQASSLTQMIADWISTLSLISRSVISWSLLFQTMGEMVILGVNSG